MRRLEYKNIFNKIIDNVKKSPEVTAITDGTNALTYEQLSRAIRIQEKYLSKYIEKNDIIIIVADKSIMSVIIILTLIKIGAVYIPIDKSCPLNRMKIIQEQAKAKYIISDEKIDINNNMVIVPNTDLDDTNLEASLYCDNVNENDLMYIIFTSGSTGIPKGVMIEHRNLFNLLESLHKSVYANIASTKPLRIAVLASFSFDPSIQQIFYALCFGHTLVLVNDRIKKVGRLVLKFFKENMVDVSDGTPSLISVYASDKRRESYNNLKLLLLGGEILRKKHIQIARNIFSENTCIINLYGPTECCVDVSYYKVTDKDKNIDNSQDEKTIIPIGKPLSNIKLLIADEDKQKQGEVIISGECIGRGYINGNSGGYSIDEAGNRVYRTGDMGYMDAAGNFYVVGRKDNQIKLYGNRIELEEIDNAIMRLPNVEFSFSILCELDSVIIICSFIKSEIVSENMISKQLSDYLPAYMIPGKMVCIDKIQLDKNGKPDKAFYSKYAQNLLKFKA